MGRKTECRFRWADVTGHGPDKKYREVGVEKCQEQTTMKGRRRPKGSGIVQDESALAACPCIAEESVYHVQRRGQFLRIDARRGAACRKSVPQRVITLAARRSCRFALTEPDQEIIMTSPHHV